MNNKYLKIKEGNNINFFKATNNNLFVSMTENNKSILMLLDKDLNIVYKNEYSYLVPEALVHVNNHYILFCRKPYNIFNEVDVYVLDEKLLFLDSYTVPVNHLSDINNVVYYNNKLILFCEGKYFKPYEMHLKIMDLDLSVKYYDDSIYGYYIENDYMVLITEENIVYLDKNFDVINKKEYKVYGDIFISYYDSKIILNRKGKNIILDINTMEQKDIELYSNIDKIENIKDRLYAITVVDTYLYIIEL